MGHDHRHNHDHHHVTGNIRLAFFLNAGFAIIEIAGGLLTNSVAILSDALHDLGDSLSLGLSWYFQKKATQKGDHKFSYGYQRFSLVGALITSIVLVSGSVFILVESAERLFEPTQPNAGGMLLLAVLGVGINLVAMLRLKKGTSLTEKVISLHFLEDVLGWAAVLIGAGVMLFVNVPILDPLLSIAIAAYVLTNVYKNLRKVFIILLQGVPADISEDQIRSALGDTDQLLGLHHIHIWSMDGNYNIMTMHAIIPDELTDRQQEKLKSDIREKLRAFNIHHVTIELESSSSSITPC